MSPTTLRALNKIVRRGKKQNLSPTRTLVSFYHLKQKSDYIYAMQNCTIILQWKKKKPKKIPYFKNKWYETVIHKKAGIIALKLPTLVCLWISSLWMRLYLKRKVRIGYTKLRLERKTKWSWDLAGTVQRPEHTCALLRALVLVQKPVPFPLSNRLLCENKPPNPWQKLRVPLWFPG